MLRFQLTKSSPISRHRGARGDQNLGLFWILRLLTWHCTCYRKEVTFKCDVIKRGSTLMWFEMWFFLTVELHIDITQWKFKSIQEKQTSVNFINSDLMWCYSLWTTTFSGFNHASWFTVVAALKHFQGQGWPKDSDSANILTSVLILCWISVETMTKWLLSHGSRRRNRMKNTNCYNMWLIWTVVQKTETMFTIFRLAFNQPKFIFCNGWLKTEEAKPTSCRVLNRWRRIQLFIRSFLSFWRNMI